MDGLHEYDEAIVSGFVMVAAAELVVRGCVFFCCGLDFDFDLVMVFQVESFSLLSCCEIVTPFSSKKQYT